MKKYLISALIMLLGFTGCLRQDFSQCAVDGNCVLQFQIVTNIEDEDIFASEINNLDIILFDRENNFVLRQQVEKEEFGDDGEVSLTVDPGYYRIVCWANKTNRSNFSEFEDESATFMSSYIEVVSEEGSSPLYYGMPAGASAKSSVESFSTPDIDSYNIHIPGNTIVRVPLNMVRAYRSVSVYVRGLHNLPGYDDELPAIELNGFPYKYDFFKSVDPARRNYRAETQEETVEIYGDLPYACINSPLCDIEDDMTVVVRQKNGVVVETINLKEYVEEEQLEDTESIRILVTIDINANITVNVPDWDEIEVNPV